jgi:multiple sugar transport system substrate-binding protein
MQFKASQNKTAQVRFFGKFGLITVLLLVCSLFLAACNGDATPTPAQVPATITPPPTATPAVGGTAANPVTITWSYWGGADETEINQKIIRDFEKRYPGIKIKTLNEPWETYFTKLKTDWVGDKAPDVMFLSFITSYAKSGLLENLEPYIERDKAEVKLDDFYAPLLNSFRYNNQLYGFPRDNDTKVIYVNLDALKEAGLEVPKGGWTWQDLLAMSRKLTVKDAASGEISRYGFAFEPNEWWKLWVWQNGGEVYNEFKAPMPPTKLLLNTPEAAGGVQFFADLINKEKVTPTYDQMDNSDKIAKLFADGKVAMAFGSHAQVPTYSKIQNLHWDVVPLPQGKQRVNVIGGAGYTINTASRHKAEAWTFLKFLSGDLGQALFASTGVMVPARQSVREDNIYLQSVKYNTQVFLDETKRGKEYPIFVQSDTIDALMDKELVPVWQGQATAAQVFAQLPAKVDPILQKAYGS